MIIEKKVKVVDKLRWRKDFNFITVYNFETDDVYKVPLIVVDIFDNADGCNSINEIIDIVLEKNNIKKTERTSEKFQKFMDYLMNNNMIVYIE